MEEYGTRGEPVVGVIGEYEPRKTKVKVYQANQHVGYQVGDNYHAFVLTEVLILAFRRLSA